MALSPARGPRLPRAAFGAPPKGRRFALERGAVFSFQSVAAKVSPRYGRSRQPIPTANRRVGPTRERSMTQRDPASAGELAARDVARPPLRRGLIREDVPGHVLAADPDALVAARRSDRNGAPYVFASLETAGEAVTLALCEEQAHALRVALGVALDVDRPWVEVSHVRPMGVPRIRPHGVVRESAHGSVPRPRQTRDEAANAAAARFDPTRSGFR